MVKRWLIGFVGLCGLGIAGFALMANRFGFDPENDWEPRRVLVALAGFGLILIAGLAATWKVLPTAGRRLGTLLARPLKGFLDLPPIRRARQGLRSRFASWRAAWTRTRVARWYAARFRPAALRLTARLRETRLVRYFAASQDRKAALAAGLLGLAMAVIYTWFVSVGTWTQWPKTTTYYNQLADAFLQGQTNLLIEPDPALLALDDPYNYENRQNATYPWDAVFYNGKFYLYWGPAPALILVAVKAIHPMEVGDNVLVFGFVLGTWLFTALLTLKLRQRLFPKLGWPYVIPVLVMAGLANPLPWLLNRPAIYEAAIAGGQFFLMAGFYLGFSALGGRALRFGRLALAGLSLAAALASRVSLAPAVLFLAAMLAWYVWRWSGLQGGKIAPPLATMGLPFVLGLGSIGWYNRIRFGSWLEFGHRYQLTGMDLHAIYSEVISPANILANLNNYLINPFRRLPVFPFIKPELGGHFVLFPISASPHYYSEQITGLLLTCPYVLLAIIPIGYLCRRGWGMLQRMVKRGGEPPVQPGEGLASWMAFTLSGASLFAFGPILLFIVATMRYLADAIPLFSLLAGFGFWWAAESLAGKPTARGWFVLLAALLTIYSVVVSLLLAVTGYQARFEHINPVLFDHLTRLFMP